MKLFAAVILILACLFAWVDAMVFDKGSLSVAFGVIWTLSLGCLVFLFVGRPKIEKLPDA